MALSFREATTGWSFNCLTDSSGSHPPAGGLVLQNIRHQGHNFAKDLRVVGLWVEFETVDPSGKVTGASKTFYTLAAPHFTTANLQLLLPVPAAHPQTGSVFKYLRDADDALDFAMYFKSGANYVGFGVKAEHHARALFAGVSNCDMAGLNVTQTFLFSRYGNAPVHEPSGALNAARCFPMITHELLPNASVDKRIAHTRVSSVRYDYRIHLSIDRHHDLKVNATLPQLGNNAGLFKDVDAIGLGTVGSGIAGGLRGLTQKGRSATSSGFSAAAFESVEKPLVLEVTAPGLAKGFDTFDTMVGQTAVPVTCWDNIHWWGSRGKGAPLISAPGAFHAAHLHWRWGAAAGGAPQFRGSAWSKAPAAAAHPRVAGRWGPLVDPNIWIQSIRLAVTKNEPSLDPSASGVAASSLSKNDWKTLFTGLRASPDDISAGDDLVLWFSIEVHREVTIPAWSTFTPPNYTSASAKTYTSANKGTIFIHGIFFAHDAETTGLQVGSRSPEYWPDSESTIRSSKQWFRSA